MNITFRFPQELLLAIHADLDRPHKFAAERVGFISCEASQSTSGDVALIAKHYSPVADDHYLDDPRVGAMMGPAAIRTALQFAYQHPVSMFHIHRHDHRGNPRFSPVDIRENARFIPDFWKVRPNQPHGAIVLSFNSMFGMCWVQPGIEPLPINKFEIQQSELSKFRGIA